MDPLNTSLPRLLNGLASADGGFRLSVPEGWLQGRTAYGGLSAALALEAALRAFPDLPPLRSAQIAFIGPLSGEVTVAPKLLRRGRTAAFVQADVEGAGGLGLRANLVFMAPQPSHVDLPPPVLAADALPPLGPPFTAPAQVAFAGRFELRETGEERDGVASLSRWARLRERDGLHPMVELLAVGDVLPPAAMRLFTRTGPISSLNWQVNLLTDAPATTDGWWLARARADHARDGASSQQMGLWNRQGQQVLAAMQAVALFV